MTTEDMKLFGLLLKWVKDGERNAFELEYGYGICEVPFVRLTTNCIPVWEGSYSEFLKWAQP